MNEQTFAITINDRNRTLVSVDTFTVIPDQITFLFGESGIGKSILAKALYGIFDHDQLSITINNHDYAAHVSASWTKAIQRSSFFVFQEPSSHLNPLIKISQQLREGTLGDSAGEQEVLRALWHTADDTAIKKIVDIYPKPYRPSGGEKQRVLLAMAFKKINHFVQSGSASLPSFFVFDEPTGNLDNDYRNLFLKLLLEKYQRKRFTVLLITHDYSIISEIIRTYPHLMKLIHFKELIRKDNSEVCVKSFSPDLYLNWLHGRLPQDQRHDKNRVVLNVDKRFSIFSKSFIISKSLTNAHPVNLTIRSGEIAYVKAPSGTGKTTLAKIIMGLYEANQFCMRLGNVTLTHRSKNVVWERKIWGRKAAMVFQHADEALDLQARVRDVFSGLPMKEKLTEEKVYAILQDLFDNEISSAFLKKKIQFLSGGQKQRLNLLRTLALQTDLLILDEPLNGLDFSCIKKVIALLEEKRKNGKAILLISHNEEIFDHIIDKESVYYLCRE